MCMCMYGHCMYGHCVYLFVCVCLFVPLVLQSLFLSACLHALVCIRLFVSACLRPFVCIRLFAPVCLYPQVFTVTASIRLFVLVCFYLLVSIRFVLHLYVCTCLCLSVCVYPFVFTHPEVGDLKPNLKPNQDANLNPNSYNPKPIAGVQNVTTGFRC